MHRFVLALSLLIGTTALVHADDKVKPKFNCHALDDTGATIAELTATSTMDCTTKILKAVKEAKCSDAANTGKTINYKQVFDAGAIAGKPVAQKVQCLKKDVKK